MQRKGFTLIELIFVIVVIGILAAVAVPKFKHLRENAATSNMISAYTNVLSNAPSAYLNLTELDGLSDRDVNMTDLIKVPAYNCTRTLRKNCWYKGSEDYIRYYIDGSKFMQFYYRNNGKIDITTYIRGTKKDLYQQALTRKLGLVFNNDTNITTIDLTE